MMGPIVDTESDMRDSFEYALDHLASAQTAIDRGDKAAALANLRAAERRIQQLIAYFSPVEL